MAKIRESVPAPSPAPTRKQKTPKHLSPQVVEELLADHKAGMTYGKLAEKYDITVVTVGNHVRKAKQKTPAHISYAQTRQLDRELAGLGLSADEIDKLLAIAYDTGSVLGKVLRKEISIT